jgi:AcrR family transcriptional regulator
MLHLVTQADEWDAVRVISGGLRERKKEKTREALARSALRLFVRRGFDHVTIEDIAAAAEVSPRTFFRYFASKEDVLFADSDAMKSRMLDVLRDQPATATPLLALQGAMLEVATDYEARRDVIVQRHRILAATPSLRGRVAERHQGWESAITAELHDSGRSAGLDDLDLRLAVAAAATALRIAVETWIEGVDERDLKSLVVASLDRLRSGFER